MRTRPSRRLGTMKRVPRRERRRGFDSAFFDDAWAEARPQPFEDDNEGTVGDTHDTTPDDGAGGTDDIGLLPVQRRKARAKARASENPSADEISFELLPG